MIDQLEELLNITPDQDRARFAGLLRRALAAGSVRAVATLRPEFLSPLLANPELAGLEARTFPLRPLPPEALATVIQQPAELAGIGVEAELVTRMVADTKTGEVLLLLAYTLAELAKGVGRGGRLSAARYDQLGGVHGALRNQAEDALAAAMTVCGRTREQVIAGLLNLVTVDEQGRPTRWRVPQAQLPDPVVAELDVFVARRLLRACLTW